jgi:hypothetical protein
MMRRRCELASAPSVASRRSPVVLSVQLQWICVRNILRMKSIVKSTSEGASVIVRTHHGCPKRSRSRPLPGHGTDILPLAKRAANRKGFVRAPLEAHGDLPLVDRHVGDRVDEVAEDVLGLAAAYPLPSRHAATARNVRSCPFET